MINTNDINQSLIKFGFSEQEIKIILALIEQGDLSITELETLTRIPRSSIYRFIDSLKDKKVIIDKLTTNGSVFSLGDFSILNTVINEQEEEIADKKNEFNNFLDLINTSKTSQLTSKPEVKYYEGVQGVRQLMWNTLNTTEPLRVYTNAIRKDIVGEKWLTDYCLEFCKRNLNEKVLVETSFAKNEYLKDGSKVKYFSPVVEYVERSDERPLKKNVFNINGEIYIYDDIFSFYTWEHKIYIGCEIHSKFLAKTQASLFDNLWEQTTEKDIVK